MLVPRRIVMPEYRDERFENFGLEVELDEEYYTLYGAGLSEVRTQVEKYGFIIIRHTSIFDGFAQGLNWSPVSQSVGYPAIWHQDRGTPDLVYMRHDHTQARIQPTVCVGRSVLGRALRHALTMENLENIIEKTALQCHVIEQFIAITEEDDYAWKTHYSPAKNLNILFWMYHFRKSDKALASFLQVVENQIGAQKYSQKWQSGDLLLISGWLPHRRGGSCTETINSTGVRRGRLYLQHL